MVRNLIIVPVGMMLLSGSQLWAQSAALTELYGEAVHRYYSKDYLGAEELLNRAIEHGSDDPRAFYFRGLARDLYGGDGQADFEEGARLEAAGRIGVNVSQALIRIQGHQRAKIEKARQDARLAYMQQRAVERHRAPPLPVLPAPSDTEAADSDPFPRGVEGLRAGEIETVPAPSVAPATEVDDSRDDPFADEPPAEDAPMAVEDDPFGAPRSDESDPFDSPASPAPDDPFAPAEAPAADSAAEDPFADPF